jgi:Zn-dependent protease
MLRRIAWLLVAVPAGLLLVTLAVANRHKVRLVLDPFRRADPVISLELPFYAYLFGALLAGVVIGGMATWMSQARWRRSARRRAVEAGRWQAEADRLGRERELEASRQLAPVNR